MANSPSSKASAATAELVTAENVERYADIVDRHGLAELVVETDAIRIKIRAPSAIKPVSMVSSVSAPVAGSVLSSAGAPMEATSPPKEASASAPKSDSLPSDKLIKSPIVGTAYLAPEPKAAPFVQPGDSVTTGQTVLIIEAMKVMNPITAPRDGVIAQIHVSDGQPVEYDEVLMSLK